MEAGARYYQHWAGEGTLVGDMQGYGGFVLFPVGEDWAVGGGVDRLYYDMETPIDVTGIRSADPVAVDAFIDYIRLRADGRRYLRRGKRWEPYGELGFHLYVADSDSPSGLVAGGGTYRLAIDTPTTGAINVSFGSNVRVAPHVMFNVALSVRSCVSRVDCDRQRVGTIRPREPAVAGRTIGGRRDRILGAMLGWGLIGAGDIVRKRVAAALRDSPGSELIAVCRARGDLAESFAASVGALRGYRQWNDLLTDPEVAAVYIATPVHLHAAQTIAAAEAGKHVLCEKPMALTAAECGPMIAACRANRRTARCGVLSPLLSGRPSSEGDHRLR